MNPFVLDWMRGNQRFLPRLSENHARAAAGAQPARRTRTRRDHW